MTSGGDTTVSESDQSKVQVGLQPEQDDPKAKVECLNDGFVRLDGYLGDDLSVVNAARVSFGKRHEKMEEGDDKLVGFLLREKHGTPFEHNVFRWHIRCPIFVAREWMRHRIGSFNEISMRYSVVEPVFYVPDVLNVRSRVGKPGAYTYQPAEELKSERFRQELMWEQEIAKENYEGAIEEGIAPELARLFLPVSVYTEFYWTLNARSLMNFLNLRTADTAQYEIRVFADGVMHLWKHYMPNTYYSWAANDKMAP